MKLYYVYILKCSDGLTYTGFTNNISRRITEHENGLNKDCFTFNRRPLKLIFSQEFSEENQAIHFEKKIKKWSSKKKFALANGDYDLLQLLAQCKNNSNSTNYHLEDNKDFSDD